MARYFIALLPPAQVQAAVNVIKQHFCDRYASRKAQNSPPHITLQPPFEWLDQQIPALEQSLQTFAHSCKPVPVQLSGFAAFAPRVIYINVVKTPELLSLQADLTSYLQDKLAIIDSASKRRAYVPHLTVAFRDLTRQNFDLAWAEFQDQTFDFVFTVPVLTLLVHDGRRWHISTDFALQSGF